MSQPLFSIGIPTFNRVAFLRESLHAALSQQYPNLEVIISDNGSTDGTEDFCRSITDPRVKYVRSPMNRGASWNFAKCLEESQGEYFSWLQDDDIIFPDFATRAQRGLEDKQAGAYLAGALFSRTPSLPYWDSVFVPPMHLDWGSGALHQVEFDLLLPLSLLIGFSFPPVVAFKADVIREQIEYFTDPECRLYGERIVLVAIAKISKVYAAPHIAGVLRDHDAQMHKSLTRNSDDTAMQWCRLIDRLESLGGGDSLDLNMFQVYLTTAPESLLSDWSKSPHLLSSKSKLCVNVSHMLRSEQKRRSAENKSLSVIDGPVVPSAPLFRRIVHQLLPPVLTSCIQKAKRWHAQRTRTKGR